jgi:hypothetical protein
MTSNIAEIFNIILRGVQSLPVTTIASFTFWLCGHIEHLSRYQKIWGPRVRYACNLLWHSSPEVRGLWRWGTTSDGEHCEAKQFMVNLLENTCTCGMPQLTHVPCPHIIVVCNHLDQNFYVSPFWLPITLWRHWFALGLLVLSHFLDEEQWEPYHGPRYVADKVMMWKKRGS